MNRWMLALVLVAGCRACDGCSPDPPDTDDTDTGNLDTSDTETVDTAPEPACAVPESEPNDAGVDADPIELEAEGCGDMNRPLDVDQWVYSVPEPTWIAVVVESTSIGSIADVGAVVAADGGDVAEARDREGGQDVRMVYPAHADTYTLLITEAAGWGASSGYYYDLLVTEVKEPVSWNREEPAAPNDSLAAAVDLASGDRLLGETTAAFDTDWYAIGVPAGAHTVTVDVDAFAEGSPANYKLILYDEGGGEIDEFRHGEQAFERDPWLSVTSPGDETLYVRVVEQDDRGGHAYWYLLVLDVKGAR